MPTDYEAIRKRNLVEYGQSVRRIGDRLLSALYSERTHFIFELLQNAEDAGATQVTFRLHKDRLEFEHDGPKLFNEEDVVGICGIIESTKTDDPSKIGKFGIGFKSVYAYTDRPEIHSGDEHFAIYDYVKPRAVEAVDGLEGRTLFVLPLNHNVPQPQAYREIASRISQLNIRTPLFLKNIRSIRWEIDDGRKGQYRREINDSGWIRHITLTSHDGHGSEKESWILFEEDASVEPTTVQIAYKVDQTTDGRFMIVNAGTSNLSVYFPTEKDTHLGFLINGPYRTTSARDNIKQDDDFNTRLIERTAELVVTSMRAMRDNQILGMDIFNALPIDGYVFQSKARFFQPIYHRVVEAFQREPLIPAHDGGYSKATDAVLTDDSALINLLTLQQLRIVLSDLKDPKWTQPTKNRNVRVYLTQVVGIRQLDMRGFLEVLEGSFLAKQSDSWMIKLYTILHTEQYEQYWGKRWGFEPIVLKRPIVRLVDGSHVAPVRHDGAPGAYFYKAGFDDLPSVKPSVTENPAAKQFLTALGITQPDVLAMVRERILPKYSSASLPSFQEHRRDTEQVSMAIKEVRQKLQTRRSQDFLQALQEAPFFRCINGDQTDTAYRKAGEIYRDTEDLRMYFAGNPDVWFLDEEQAYGTILEFIDVSEEVRVHMPHWKQNHDFNPYVVIIARHGLHKRGLDFFDPDCEVDGLEYSLRYPSVDRAAYIWNQIAIRYYRAIHGTVETSSRQTYENSRTEQKPSKMGRLLRSCAWLPDINGDFHRPSGLKLDELPDVFKRDERVALKLGMPNTQVAELQSLLDLSDDQARAALENPERVKAFLDGLQPEGTLDGLSELDVTLYEEQDLLDSDPETYRDSFRDRFDRSSSSHETGEPPEYVQTRTPSSGSRSRFDPTPYVQHSSTLMPFQTLQRSPFATDLSIKRYTKRVFGVPLGKNPNTRIFLERQYSGECQICGYTFSKRSDGRPYFEAVYVVSNRRHESYDNPGNVICLCANHAAEYLYGSITSEIDVEEQILTAGEHDECFVHVVLCGVPVAIRYTQSHIRKLKDLLSKPEDT